MRDALKVRATFKNAMASSHEVLEQIDSSATWAWAKTTERSRLCEMREQMRLEVTSWGQDFIVCDDANAFKKGFTLERITVELNEFLKVSSSAKKLNDQCVKLVKAHGQLYK